MSDDQNLVRHPWCAEFGYATRIGDGTCKCGGVEAGVKNHTNVSAIHVQSSPPFAADSAVWTNVIKSSLDELYAALGVVSHGEALQAIRNLKAAVANQRGDDLCWLTEADLEKAKALPAAEFLESCRRYHAQLVAERGEATGLKTIAQLEAENEQLREERDEAQHQRDHVIKMSQRPGYDAEREGAAFFGWLLEPDKPHDKYAMAIAFLKLWANSYLLKGNFWDVPHTMGAALNQAITALEAPMLSAVSELRDGEENDGPLQSTDLFIKGRGISLLVNVTVDGFASYSLSVDNQHERSGRLTANK